MIWRPSIPPEEPIPNINSKLIADVAIQSGHHGVICLDRNDEIVAKIWHLEA